MKQNQFNRIQNIENRTWLTQEKNDTEMVCSYYQQGDIISLNIIMQRLNLPVVIKRIKTQPNVVLKQLKVRER